jgi:hypothetical protein
MSTVKTILCPVLIAMEKIRGACSTVERKPHSRYVILSGDRSFAGE